MVVLKGKRLAPSDDRIEDEQTEWRRVWIGHERSGLNEHRVEVVDIENTSGDHLFAREHDETGEGCAS